MQEWLYTGCTFLLRTVAITAVAQMLRVGVATIYVIAVVVNAIAAHFYYIDCDNDNDTEHDDDEYNCWGGGTSHPDS